MKFGVQFLLLFFFVSLLPTFLNAAPKDCAVDGKCTLNGQKGLSLLFGTKSRSCTDGICYAYKCITGIGIIMHGSGCYDDFVNTCAFIQSNITEDAKGNKKYKYHDENVIVVSCGGDITDLSNCAQTKLQHYDTGNVKEGFGKDHVKPDDMSIKCEYDNEPLTVLPKVQCYKGGQCFAGEFNVTDFSRFPNVTCNACSRFICHQNGVTKSGSGCFEDFERICTNVPSDVMQKMKANEKNYYYVDENTFMTSCSFADNCHFAAMILFTKTLPRINSFDEYLNLKPSDKTCEYEPSKSIESTKNGANGFELSGMLIFGFILFYLW